LEREGLIERSFGWSLRARIDTYWTIAPTFEALLRAWKSKDAILLPEAQWKDCGRHKAAVPEFEFSESFEKEISGLLRTTHPNPVPVMHRLHQEGYEFGIGKAWALHHGPYKQEQTLCPWCGKPLRTNEAKQCRFCGKDWH
jgi:hypothetical protein